MVIPSYDFANKQDFVQLAHNGLNLIRNGVVSNHLNARMDAGRDSLRKPHRLGFFLVNDKEGPYLNRFRGMLQYAYSISLGPELIWQNGVSMGMVNIAIKPNDAQFTESVYAPDADLGTFLRRRNLYGGVSVNQLFNNQMRFLHGTIHRYRFYSITAGFIKTITPRMDLKMDVYGRTGNYTYNKFVFSTSLLFSNHMVVGLSAKSSNGIIPIVGIRDLPVLKNKFTFLFSYLIPTSRVILAGSGNFELQLEYKF